MNGNISSNIIVKPIKDAGTKVIRSFARQGEEIIQEVLNTPQQQEVVSPVANEAIANSTFGMIGVLQAQKNTNAEIIQIENIKNPETTKKNEEIILDDNVFKIGTGSGRMPYNIAKATDDAYGKFIEHPENIRKLEFCSKLDNADYNKLAKIKEPDFLCFAAGIKPVYYATKNMTFENMPDGYHKISIKNDQMLLLNDKKVKTIIQNNLQLFNVLLDKKDLSDKDIYKLLSSDNKENPLKQKPFRSDIVGIILGYPKLSSILFYLRDLVTPSDGEASDVSQKDLLKYMKSEKCFYKNKSLKKHIITTLENNELKKSNIISIGNILDKVGSNLSELGKILSQMESSSPNLGISFHEHRTYKKNLPLQCCIFVDEPDEVNRISMLYGEYTNKLNSITIEQAD